jgi:hypothetical protein
MEIILLPQLSALNYLDPGTGSLIIQLLLGALLAIGLGVRIFWSRIKKIFTRKPSVTDDPSQDKSDDSK